MSFNKQWGDINEKYTACKLPSINGKPSQLTKEEFITVRTENFKLFFGDWEKAYEEKIEYVRAEALSRLWKRIGKHESLWAEE